MLELPDIRQTEDYDCGRTAVLVVCRWLGVKAPGVPVNAVQGACPATLEACLRAAGLPVLSGTMTVPDLKHLTCTRPVLCPMSFAGGHWVVVGGVWRGRVCVQCPADGPKRLKVADFLAAWEDTSRDGHEYRRWGICVG